MPLGSRACGFVRPEGVRARPTQPRRIEPIHRNARTPWGAPDCPGDLIPGGTAPGLTAFTPFGAR